MKLALKIFAVVLIFVFFYSGFVPSEPCDIDKASLYCQLHPFSLLDFIGCALFIVGTLSLFGFFEIIQEEWDIEPKDWRWLSAGLIVVGFLLTLI